MVKRRETLATRKRRAVLARERQNQFGRWESNKQKALARKARRTSLGLGPLFERSRAKVAATEARMMGDARALSVELVCAKDEASLISIIARLDSLVVSPLVLRRTLIGRKLNDAMKKFPAVRSACKRIIIKWRTAFRSDVAKAKEVATSPSKVAQKASCSPAAVTAQRAPSGRQQRSESASVATLPSKVAQQGACSAAAVTAQREPSGRQQRSDSASSSSSTSSSSSCSASRGTPQLSTATHSSALQSPTPAPKPCSRRPLKQKRITAFLAPAGA